MLTLGYSRYEWKKILPGNNQPPKYQPETALSLSGTIKTLSGKPIPNGKIRLTSVKDMFSVDTLSDANGSFTFTNLYLNDSTKFIINAKKANGGDNVKIAIWQSKYPTVSKTTSSVYIDKDNPISEQLFAALKKTYITGQQNYLKNTIL